MANALKAFTILTREQKAALSRALDGFVDCLASATNPNPHARAIATENAWHNRANWNEDEWVTWETWGWYRHFCRMVGCFLVLLCGSVADYAILQYTPYLRNYSTTLGTVSFAKVGNSGDPAVELFRRIWNITTGQES